MSQFQSFDNKFKKKLTQLEATPEELKYLAKNLSVELADFIEEKGFSSFDAGFWWFTNPKKYQEVLSLWDINPKNNFMIARTAFADLFIWNEGSIIQLRANFGKLVTVAEDLSFFLEYIMCDDKYAYDLLLKKHFEAAHEQLGELTETECYGFVPALALGGVEAQGNLQKLQIIEYLKILAVANNQ